jgi:hypothetical protein
MKNRTVSLGDLVTTAYDQAAMASSDPREVSALAHRTIEQLLRTAHRAAPLQRARR